MKSRVRIIQGTVSRFHDVSVEDMAGRSRRRQVVLARQTAMWLTREITRASLSQIGAAFGGRDHSTVLYSIRQVDKRLTNPQTAAWVQIIRSQAEGLIEA